MYSLRVFTLVSLFVLQTFAENVDFEDILEDAYPSKLLQIIIPSNIRLQRHVVNDQPTNDFESLRSKRQFDYDYENPSGYGGGQGGFGGGPGGFGGGPGGFGGPSGQFGSSNANSNSQGFNAGGFGGSSAAANANSQGQYFGPNGFGGSAANAQSQAFNSQGPLGGFGASAANTQTQSFNAGPNGIQGSAALAGSQAYHLPNGQTLNVAYSNGYSIGPDGKPTVSNANSVGFTR